MKGLNIARIIKDNNFVVVSSEDALKNIIPMNWSEDVLSKKKEVIISDIKINRSDKQERPLRTRKST